MRLISSFIIFLFILSCGNADKHQKSKSEISNLSNAIKEDPTNVDLILNRVKYNIRNKRFDSALFDLKQCLSLDSNRVELHYMIAEIYFDFSKKPNANRKYPGLAKFHLEKYLKKNNSNYLVHALYGELLLAYKNYKQSLYHLNQSLSINYNQEKTHLLMGFLFNELGKEKEAINCFRNAILIQPDYTEAYVQLGQIYHSKLDTMAVTYYDNALQISPNNELVLYNKAVFYQETANWNKSLVAYADLLNVSPFHANAHYNLGFIHMELKLFDVAVNNFSDAIYSDNLFYEAYYSRGVCHETLGNIMQAEVDYKRAIEIDSNYVYAIEALQELQEKNKNYKN